MKLIEFRSSYRQLSVASQSTTGILEIYLYYWKVLYGNCSCLESFMLTFVNMYKVCVLNFFDKGKEYSFLDFVLALACA